MGKTVIGYEHRLFPLTIDYFGFVDSKQKKSNFLNCEWKKERTNGEWRLDYWAK